MKLQRLLTLTPAEIACRSQQGTVKTVDRLMSARRGNNNSRKTVLGSLVKSPNFMKLHQLRMKGEDERAAEELLEYYKQQLPARFFEGVSAPATPNRIKECCPDHVDKTLRSADDVCQALFQILGYGKLSYGSPVNWHLDPIADIQAPLTHWSKIDALNCSQVGDNKVIWELNRHQWLLDLGQAYLFTGDERYAHTFENLLTDWVKHNPAGIGINWSSSLEVALRLIAWCWALMFFRQSPVMTPALFTTLLEGIKNHACHIERYLSYYYSPNTHLTGEALGLCYAAMLFPELKESRRWRSLGERILKEQIVQQVHPDGVYFEQSTRYQYYTIEIYLHFMLLSGRNEADLPVGLTDRLKSMLSFLLAARHPNGDMPQIGDADGGWLLPLVRRDPVDFRSPFALGALMFRQGDLAWAAGAKITPEALWLLGDSGLNTWRQLQATPPSDGNPGVFKQGGYGILRTHWKSDAHQLIFDFGPLGCRYSSGHGHADLLSIQCCVFGEPYIVDAGTGCYRGDSKWRTYFRSADAHSTVIVDGMNQAEPNGPFSWSGKKPAASLEKCEIGEKWQMLDACREDCRSAAGLLTHRRRVLFTDGWWLVIDDLYGDGEHEIAANFQFAPLALRREPAQWVRAIGKQGNALLLKCFSSRQVDTDIASGSLEPLKGWVSPNYGQQRPSPALTFSIKSSLPARMVTLFLPLREPDASVPEASMEEHNGETKLALSTGILKQLVSIDEDSISVEEAA